MKLKSILSVFLSLLIVVMVFCCPIIKSQAIIEASAAGPMTFTVVSYVIICLLTSIGISLAASPEFNMHVADGIYDDMQQAQKNIVDNMAAAYEATINNPDFTSTWEHAVETGGVVSMDWSVTDYKSVIEAISDIIAGDDTYGLLIPGEDYDAISNGDGNGAFTNISDYTELLVNTPAFSASEDGDIFTFYTSNKWSYKFCWQIKFEDGHIKSRRGSSNSTNYSDAEAKCLSSGWSSGSADVDFFYTYFVGSGSNIEQVYNIGYYYDVNGQPQFRSNYSMGIPGTPLEALVYASSVDYPCDVPITRDRTLTPDVVLGWINQAELEGALSGDDVLSLPMTLDPTVADVGAWPVDAAGNLVTSLAPVLQYGADLSVPVEIVDSLPAELPITDLKINANIITKFPFCIPFDIYNIFSIVNTSPRAPIFIVPFAVGDWVDYDIRLDLTVFDDVIAVIRWFELAIFCAGLAYATRNLIKW